MLFRSNEQLRSIRLKPKQRRQLNEALERARELDAAEEEEIQREQMEIEAATLEAIEEEEDELEEKEVDPAEEARRDKVSRLHFIVHFGSPFAYL